VSESRETPEIVNQAYDILLQHRIVEVTRPLGWDPERRVWTFECMASVPYPNRENIPSEVPLLVLIHEAFPLAPVEFYPLCDEVTGFPHQDAESGKLCLREEYLAPRNAKRLVRYTNWAKDWLADAADGTLLKPGDPYELPAFISGSSLPISQPVLFSETEESYEEWKPNIGRFGSVECVFARGIPAIFAVRFHDSNNSVVWESEFSPAISAQGSPIVGKWLILPDIRYARHRPPKTFEEIEKLCSNNDVDFYDILKTAWEIKNRDPEIGLIMVGFPIPKIYGEKPVEIHWQPLLFSNLRAEQKERKRKNKSRKVPIIWRDALRGYFSQDQRLPWGRSTNIAHDRLYARGSYSSLTQSARIVVFGCGALGSLVSELLVRGGVGVLDLFDRDIVQIGNLCRHTLDGSHLGLNKAKSLAMRLSNTNPLSSITGYPFEIPLSSSSLQYAKDAISKADLFIDCTTSESAFEWLDHFAATENKRLVSMFFNFHAELLTLCISGSETSCGEVFQDLLACVKNDQLPIASTEYLYQPTKEEQIMEGTGCWHPTFPALNAHIQMLAATAVDIINAHIEQGERKGLAVLIRRNTLSGGKIQPGPLVEVIWTKQYP